MPQTAWSCASAYAADWEGAQCGASVAPEARRKRGAAARHTASQAAMAAVAALPASPAPAPADAATYSGAPMGVPRATNPRFVATPRLRAELRDARRSGAPGAIVDTSFAQTPASSSTAEETFECGARAIGHGDDIQVVQESSEKLSRPELLGSRHQRRVLRKGKQGGSQRVALLTAIAL